MPMHLTTAPELAAEVPGCAQEQLDRLARSVEARRQQLEEDINAYIARKQDELRQYESEVGGEPRAFLRLSGLRLSIPIPTLPGAGRTGQQSTMTVAAIDCSRLTRPSL